MSPQNKQHGRVQAHKRAAAQAAARAAAQRRQRRLRAGVGGAIAIVVVLAVVLALFPNDGPDPAATTTTTTATTEPTTTTTTAPIVDETIPDDFSQNVSAPFIYGTAECAPATKPAEPPESFADAPKSCLTPGVDYRAVVETDHGSFTIDLLEKRAPGTVNNFVQLAKWGWFDGQGFHRVVPGFVNQTGDPKGDGTGGPGYAIADELPPAVTSYARWAVAMANSGPNTNGSQWFTCIDCRILPTPAYSIFGQVVEGTDIAQAINDLGTSDGPPSEPVLITSLTIIET